MENEFQKMQRLAGVPVTKTKKQLDENFVGMPMVGNIFDRPKADYELAYEHYLGKLNENEVEEGKIEEGAFGDLLGRMERNTRLTADVLKVINLAKEDKEGNADIAVQLMMDRHGLDEETATDAVTRIFKNAFEWVDSNELNEVEDSNSEVILSNEILDFLEERGIIDPSDAQKVHKDLTSFLKSKTNGKKEDEIPSNPEDYTKQPGYVHEEEGADGEENPIDSITMDVPLFIRMLEFAREDASTDMDLHDVAEKATALSAEGEILSMDNYENIVGGETEELDEVGHFKYTSKRGYGDKKVGTYLGKYPIYQDDEGNNYIKTGSGIKDVEDLDQSKVKINN